VTEKIEEFVLSGKGSPCKLNWSRYGPRGEHVLHPFGTQMSLHDCSVNVKQSYWLSFGLIMEMKMVGWRWHVCII